MKYSLYFLTVLVCLFNGVAIGQTEFYVNPVNGFDNAEGSKAAPLKTIEAAQQKVRSINKNTSSDIVVYLRGGMYQLDKTLLFTEKDGGQNNYKVIYKAYKDEKPVITGGKALTGWKQVSGKGYYKTSIPISAGFPSCMRNIFVNGKRAFQARSPFVTAHYFNYDDPKTPQIRDGVFVKSSDIKHYTNINDVYFFQCGAFKHIEIPVLSLFDWFQR